MATRRSNREEQERAEYARLHAKYGRPQRRSSSRRDDQDDQDDDDAPMLVLAGRRADAFLSRMFDDAPARGRHRDDQGDDDQGDDDQGDDDQGDDDQDDAGDPPPARRGFFGDARRRG